MPGVRSVLIKNWTTFTQLDVKRTLKVAARFVQQKPEEMQRVFDKAEARKEASVAVYEAIQRLWKDQSIANSYDLNFMDLVREEVKRHEGTKNSQRLHNADFHVAVNDWTWKATVGSRQGNLAILLKNRETDGSRPALRALEAGLHKAAKGDPKEYETALKLAALLDAVKNCPTEEGSNVRRAKSLRSLFTSHSDTLEELAVYLPVDGKKNFQEKVKALSENLKVWEDMAARRPTLKDVLENNKSEYKLKVAQAFIDAYGKDLENISDFIGDALTELLHPGLKTALAAARQCPISPIDARSLDHKYILKMFNDCFDFLSSKEVWSNQKVKDYLYEYYGVALSIAALDKLRGKTKFTRKDIDVLNNTLKEGPEASANAAQRKKEISKAFNRIDLKGKPEVVLFDLSKVVADHYIDRGILNLVNHEEEDAKVALAVATSANDMIKVLEDVFFTAINGKLDRQQFFQPLEDLAASRGQS